MPVQGTACGTLKLVMGAVQEDLEVNNLLEVAHPLLPVHDELLLETREDVAEEIAALIRYRFETCVRLRVPIKASSATSLTWGSLQK